MRFEIPKPKVTRVRGRDIEVGYKITDRRDSSRYCIVSEIQPHPHDASVVQVSAGYPDEGYVRLFLKVDSEYPVILPYQEQWRPSDS